MDLKSKRWYKNQVKNHKGIITVLFVVLMVFGIISMTTYTKANLFDYIQNIPLNLTQDKVYLEEQIASESNEWRNYFESGCSRFNKIYPIIEISDDGVRKFSMIQVYLTNLDDTYAFGESGYHQIYIYMLIRSGGSGSYVYSTVENIIKVYENRIRYEFVENRQPGYEGLNPPYDLPLLRHREYTTEWNIPIEKQGFSMFELNFVEYLAYTGRKDWIRFNVYLDDVLFHSQLTVPDLYKDMSYQQYHHDTYIRYHSYNSVERTVNGFLGNYIYPCLKGIRYCMIDEYTDSPYFLPMFKETLVIFTPDVDPPDDTTYDKPEGFVCPSGRFWLYNSYIMDFSENYDIVIGNNNSKDLGIIEWNLEYPKLQVVKEQGVFCFVDYTHIFTENWGTLGAFNWLRDVLNFLIGKLLDFLQVILYLLILAFNYIIMFFLVGIILGFLWNIVLRYGLIGILYLGWFIWIGLLLLWNYILLPFFEWFINDFIPLAIKVLIVVASFIIALLIWCATLCQANFSVIFDNVSNMLTEIVNEIIEWIQIFVVYLPYFFAWIIVYIILVGLIYVKYLYFKSKGWIENANEMYELFTTFIYPFRVVMNLYGRLKGSKSEK